MVVEVDLMDQLLVLVALVVVELDQEELLLERLEQLIWVVVEVQLEKTVLLVMRVEMVVQV